MHCRTTILLGGLWITVIVLKCCISFFAGTKKAPESNEKELTALGEENRNLKELLETRDKRISLLEGQLKGKEQKYLNDMKLVQRNVAELKSEIDAKSNTIAHLTAQLHQLKVRGTKSVTVNGPIVPTPPSEGYPSMSRPTRRSITSPLMRSLSPGDSMGAASHQVDVSDLPLGSAVTIRGKNLPHRPAQSLSDPARPALGHSAARRERKLHLYSRPKPTDYKELIDVQQQSIEHDITPKARIEPLPPISASKNGRQHAVPHLKTKSNRPEGNTSTRSNRGEITEVVVEPLSSPERTWRKLQDSKYKE